MLKYRKIFYIFSGTLALVSLVSIFLFGIKLGIDFTGGSLLEISLSQEQALAPSKIEKILESDESLKLGDIRVQMAEQNFIIRSRTISEDERKKIIDTLQKSLEKWKMASIQQVRF